MPGARRPLTFTFRAVASSVTAVDRYPSTWLFAAHLPHCAFFTYATVITVRTTAVYRMTPCLRFLFMTYSFCFDAPTPTILLLLYHTTADLSRFLPSLVFAIYLLAIFFSVW